MRELTGRQYPTSPESLERRTSDPAEAIHQYVRNVLNNSAVDTRHMFPITRAQRRKTMAENESGNTFAGALFYCALPQFDRGPVSSFTATACRYVTLILTRKPATFSLISLERRPAAGPAPYFGAKLRNEGSLSVCL